MTSATSRETLATIKDQDLVPVLVADDTDRLLNVGFDEQERERLFTGFFGEVLREIAENLECGLLLAAHRHYHEHPSYAEMTSGLLSSLRVPAVQRPRYSNAELLERAERSPQLLRTGAGHQTA